MLPTPGRLVACGPWHTRTSGTRHLAPASTPGARPGTWPGAGHRGADKSYIGAMPASGYLALRPAGNAPAGPARTTVAAVIARTTSVIRGMVLAYIVAQVLI